MSLTMLQRSRAAALKRWYLVDDLAAVKAPSAKHAYWQAPLLYGTSGDLDETWEERVRLAGRLWLRNFDLSSSSHLVLHHAQSGWAFVFCRAFEANQMGTVVGPVKEHAHSPGPCLFNTPIAYCEYEAWDGA